MRRLAIVGASGHGKVVADAAEALGWDLIEFYDDAWPELTILRHWPVKGDFSALLENLENYEGVIVAIGDNHTRLSLQQELEDRGSELVTLVHPGACVSPYASLGTGSVILAGAAINIDATLGKACIINTNASVDHDCSLDDGVHVSPGAALAGGVSVGQCSWVGIGASVRQLIAIGADVVVGAGSCVVAPLADGQTYVGMPARPFQRN
ncbi:acetyltransferase [Marinobacter sp. SS21]|uniref:acetyltransferase n=1 Tax=Marinobacter sp. SS21 TaxID=2979460 RepID=UPI00232EE829|nr:acetyltransferase [Marinobacter sp. SS21]MDC0664177.1 acetyltransferase [Marinobacter sp. SS21]